MLLYQHNPLLYHKLPFKLSDENEKFWKFFRNKTPEKPKLSSFLAKDIYQKRDINKNHIRHTNRN